MTVCVAAVLDVNGNQVPPAAAPLYLGTTFLTGGFNLLVTGLNGTVPYKVRFHSSLGCTNWLIFISNIYSIGVANMHQQ